MAGIARVVAPGLLPPCHPARQSARARVFRGRRRPPLSPAGRHGGAGSRHSRLGLCMMPNHVHLPIMPTWRDAGGRGWLRAIFAEAHRRYTGAINARFRWTDHLFQGRFGAVVMDEPHLLAAARYIALNLVVAGRWSRGW